MALEIENFISPFIQKQFPSFYLEEGETFVAFVKAYYEWLENNYQLITVDSNTGFMVGDSVQQTSSSGIVATGTVVSIEGNDILIKLPSYDTFVNSAQFTNDDHIVSITNNGNSHVVDVKLLAPVYQARNIFKSRDVDTTMEQFILHFKEKYLKNIDFNTATNKNLLIKNSLDLYRAKGTEKAVDLFFRLVYGTDARVYYPGQDILKVSDGEWTIPAYIEVTDTSRTVDYVGKVITGSISRATAFVERYIKRRVSGSMVCVLYVSNINGTFVPNEPLESDKLYSDSPKIVGSLNYVDIITGGDSFSIGDIVSIGQTTGEAGLGRVVSTTNTTGIVDFLLLDGGWGYTASAQTIVSDKVLTLSNVVTTNTAYFRYFDTFVQPQANVQYGSGNATFSNGEIVRYYSNSTTVASEGIVYTVSPANTTVGSANGYLLVNLYKGNTLPVGANLVNSGNTKFANVVAFSDISASATVMGLPNTSVITINSNDRTFQKGVTVIQGNSSTTWATGYCNGVIAVGSTTILTLANTTGAFRKSANLTISGSSVNSSIINIQLTCGIYGIQNGFNTSGLYAYSAVTGTTANLINASTGYGATFNVGSLGDVETIFVDTDLLNANNGNTTSANAYTDNSRKTLTVANATGFNAGNVVFQEVYTIGFVPSTAVNATSGFITITTANTYFNAGDYVKYRTGATDANGTINDTSNNVFFYVKSSNSTGLTLGRGYDYTTYNSTNFPNFANNLSKLTQMQYLTKVAFGNVISVNATAGTIVVSGSQNLWGNTPAYSANATQYANSALYLYNYTTSSDGLKQVTPTALSTNTNITSVGSAASANIAKQVIRTLSLNQAAYGLVKNPYGALNDILWSELNYQNLSLGTIGTISGINPGNTYNVDPYVLINQPYISGYGRHDYVMTLSGTIGSFAIGEKIKQTPTALTTYTLKVSNTTPFSVGEKIYQGTKVSPTATAIVNTFVNSTAMIVGNVTGTLQGNATTTVNVYSFVTTANTPVSNITTQTQYITAQSIVKSTSYDSTTGLLTIYAKRINFNNTWQNGQVVTGQSSGANGTIVGVAEDMNSNVIGLNAIVTANVVVANGTVTALEIKDSGFGYIDNNTGEFFSADGSRAGTLKIHTGGVGKGSGYYKSSKGFLSDNKYIQDNDYYQEYSYEIISKLPFDKYSEMYGKVMHMAGTRVFGSVEVSETATLPAVKVGNIQKNEQISFNANSNVNGTNETIYVGVQKDIRGFDAYSQVYNSNDFISVTTDTVKNPNPFKVGDQVLYYNTSGATVTGLSNNTLYYVNSSNTSGVSLSATLNGANIDITQLGVHVTHYLQSYKRIFSDGDIVRYTTDTGNVAVQGLTNAASYYIVNSTPTYVQLSLTSNGAAINITANSTASGTATSGHYLEKVVEE